MKKLAIASLLSLAIPFAVAPMSQAQTSPTPATNPSSLEGSLGPIDLVGLAYQGFLEEEGIPKFNRLTDGYITGRITPEDVIRAGISAERIPAAAASDPAYINTVDWYLQDLSRDQGNS